MLGAQRLHAAVLPEVADLIRYLDRVLSIATRSVSPLTAGALEGRLWRVLLRA